MEPIGFIGLGIMGGHFALNLRKAGIELMVHDLDRSRADAAVAAGGKWAGSIEALARSCSLVLLSLPGPPEVTTVAGDPKSGLIAHLRPGSVCFDLSTNSPTVARQLAAEFAARDLQFLDAPVSGGPAGAASGKLAIWVGGSKPAFDQHRHVLDVLGDQVRYIGAIGAGSVAKLVHNSAGYAVQCALAEVFTMGIKAGVPPLALFEAVRHGVRGRQRTFDSLAEHFLIDDYDPPAFALRLAHKDVALAAEVGRDVEVPMRFVDLTRAELAEAINRGWGDRDSRSAMLLQLERAGLEIKENKEAVERILTEE